jgi:hypothetical protein
MEEIHINNVKKIAILSLVIAMTTGFTRAAKHQSGPDATLRLSTNARLHPERAQFRIDGRSGN